MECGTTIGKMETADCFSGPVKLHFCGWESCMAQHSFGPAVRRHYLIHYVTEGSGRFFKNPGTDQTQEYRLQKGQGFLICPGESTLYVADAQTPWTYYWVGFTGLYAQSILSSAGLSISHPVFSCPDGSAEKCARSLGALYDSLYAGNRSELAALGYFYLFLSLIAPQKQDASLNPQDMYVAAALNYIRENYSYNLSVQSISDFVGINRSHLFRLFQSKVGTSVQKYLLNYRLRMAALMLSDPSHTVNEVCYSCGFSDPNYFSRMFKSVYGITPSRFRGSQRPQSQSTMKSGDENP